MSMFDSVVRRTLGHRAERDTARLLKACEDLNKKLEHFPVERTERTLSEAHPDRIRLDEVMDLSKRLLEYQVAETVGRKLAPAEGRQQERRRQFQELGQENAAAPGPRGTTDQTAGGPHTRGTLEYILHRIIDRMSRPDQAPRGALDRFGDRGRERLNNHALDEKVYDSRYHSLRRLGRQAELAKQHPLLKHLSGDAWSSRSGFRHARTAKDLDLRKIHDELSTAVANMEQKYGTPSGKQLVLPAPEPQQNTVPTDQMAHHASSRYTASSATPHMLFHLPRTSNLPVSADASRSSSPDPSEASHASNGRLARQASSTLFNGGQHDPSVRTGDSGTSQVDRTVAKASSPRRA